MEKTPEDKGAEDLGELIGLKLKGTGNRAYDNHKIVGYEKDDIFYHIILEDENGNRDSGWSLYFRENNIKGNFLFYQLENQKLEKDKNEHKP